MRLLDLLDALDAAGVTLIATGGRIAARGPRPAIAAHRDAIAEHRDLLLAHLIGRRTGHLLAFCETCGAATITAAKTTGGKLRDSWPACRETPGCGGVDQHHVARARHVPRPVDLAAMRDAPAPPTRPQTRGAGRRSKSRFTTDRSAA